MNSGRIRVLGRVALILALVVGVAACSSDSADSSDDASSDTTASATASTVDPGPDWVEQQATADCKCAFGDEFTFYTRTVEDSDKVLLYFQGGGACFSADTCAEGGDDATSNQTVNADEILGTDDQQPGGIFDFTNADNPFNDYSVVYVPYCTGDLHLGDSTHTYSDDVTVNHFGFRNASAGEDYVLENFPDATEVVVAGSSAGGVPSPLFGGLVADELPDATVSVLADASGAYPSVPAVNAAIGSLWGAFNNVPDWPENEGLTAEDYGVPDLFTQTGLHNPDVRLARYDAAYDETQQAFSDLVGFAGADLLEAIQGNEARIEDAGVPIHSYTAPGTVHTILGRPEFYTLEVEGVSFLDWVNEYLAGDDVDDVVCTDCEPPAPADTTDETTDTTQFVATTQTTG